MSLRCGVIGLGQMGGGIAANLAEAGMLAAVWDSDAAAMDRCPGTRRGLGAVAACDVVLLAVPGSAQIAEAFEGGLLDAGTGGVLVDLTTSDPAATRALADQAQAAGLSYLDAGMSGGAAGAQEGRLTLMIGGAAQDVTRIRPALEVIATQIFHVGPSGAGHVMKLVHNMICHTIFLATAEGCRAAERAGIPLANAVEVLNAGNARSFVSERRFPDHIIPGSFDGRSVAGNLAKDLAMAAALFDELGQPSVYADLTASLLAQAGPLGLMGHDFTRLYPAYDRLVTGIRDE